MSRLVSMVGHQPSAVAVALATWARLHPGPHHVVLLPTGATEGVAERLRAWAARAGFTCELRPIADSLTPRDGRPAAPEAVKALRDVEAPVFLADAGLKFLVVAAVQALPPGALLAHADSDHLHVRAPDDTWRALPLADLGLGALLDLYGVDAQVKPAAPSAGLTAALRQAGAWPLPGHVCALRFGAAASEALDLAYEARGQLFGLAFVERGDELPRVRGLMRLANALPGLRPRVALASGERKFVERARLEGHLQPIDARSRAGLAALQRWVRGSVPPPGQARRASSHDPPPASLKLGRVPADGVRLAVCVGDDPAATLVSLATHRPAVATVLYDAQTPAVVENARRLAQCLDRLGVAEGHFVPTDRLGRGLAAGLENHAHDLCADTTPGTKAQGCALARVPGLALWSQDARAGWARPLGGGTQAVPLRAPSSDVCALVNGGELLDPGQPLAEEQADFYRLLGAFVLCRLRRQQGYWRLADLRSGRCGCAHGGLVVGQGEGAGGRRVVTVRHDGRAVRAMLDPRGGYWFEPVVGHAFRAAGCTDVRIGVKWRWPAAYEEALARKITDARRPHRTDVDVLARWRHWYVVVECKTGPAKPLEEVRRTVEAMTQVGVGRMGLPVVVRPQISPRDVAESLERGRGSVVLNLATVCDPEELADVLELAFQKRSTRP